MKHHLITKNIIYQTTSMLPICRITQAGQTHPFGDARTVQQAFPSGVNEREADPFLMCDYFNSIEQNGPSQHPDDFPVNWHPHRGFDIASYLKTGVGRHADSLGNRETYQTPGMQWMNTGSGVMHAEGGSNEKGDRVQGFQIWINVPQERKMDKPAYGTVTPDNLPRLHVGDGIEARVLAGTMFDHTGPFQTKQDVQMIDFEFEPRSTIETSIAAGLDTALLYVYEGSLSDINGQKAASNQSVVLFDANDESKCDLKMTAGGEEKTGVLLFAGKKLKQPIAWHGPIVMNTQQQIQGTFRELRSGEFPPVRVDWNYKEIASRPGK